MDNEAEELIGAGQGMRANSRAPSRNGNGSFTYVLSDEAVDSHGTEFRVAGWDLERYRNNPVVLWAHNRELLPVGRASSVYTEDRGGLASLLFDVQFARAEDYGHDWPSAYPAPPAIEAMTAAGYLRGASVGFLPREAENVYIQDPGGAKRFSHVRILRQELTEGSVCPVPSNPGTLVRCLSEGHLTLLQLPEILRFIEGADPDAAAPEMVRAIREELSAPKIHPVALPGIGDALRRELREIAEEFAGTVRETIKSLDLPATARYLSHEPTPLAQEPDVGELESPSGPPCGSSDGGRDLVELLMGPSRDLDEALAWRNASPATEDRSHERKPAQAPAPGRHPEEPGA